MRHLLDPVGTPLPLPVHQPPTPPPGPGPGPGPVEPDDQTNSPHLADRREPPPRPAQPSEHDRSPEHDGAGPDRPERSENEIDPLEPETPPPASNAQPLARAPRQPAPRHYDRPDGPDRPGRPELRSFRAGAVSSPVGQATRGRFLSSANPAVAVAVAVGGAAASPWRQGLTSRTPQAEPELARSLRTVLGSIPTSDRHQAGARTCLRRRARSDPRLQPGRPCHRGSPPRW